MPQVDFRRRRGAQRPQQTGKVIRDFSKLQKTELDPDKNPFEAFSKARNVVHKGLNAEVRRGTLDLGTVADIISMGFQYKDDENTLLGMVDTGSTSKLVSIDRSTGGTTDEITGITGDGTAYFASLRQTAYVANGSANIQLLDSAGSAGTEIVLPSSGIAKFVASDTECLWVSQTDGIVRASAIVAGDVATANFEVSGSGVDRAFVVETNILNVKSFKSNGKLVCIAGDDSIEIHKRPGFEGVSTFPAGTPTLQVAYSNIGVSSYDAVIPYSNGFFVKPKDGTLYFIAPGLQKPQEFRDNLQEMEDMDWSNCAMGIDLNKKILFITGKNKVDYDRTIAFNIHEQNFSYYDGIKPKQWLSDVDNMYFIKSYAPDIVDAFGETQYTDNGANIGWEIETGTTYGSLQNYWKATKFFMNVRVWQDIDVAAQLFVDQKTGKAVSAAWSNTFSLTENSSVFGAGIAGFGSGVMGGIEGGLSMYHEESDLNTEYFDLSEYVNTTFGRAFLRLSGSSSAPLQVRGLGMNISPTNREIRSISMT